MSATIAARSHSGSSISSASLAAPVRRVPQPRRAPVSPMKRIGRLVGRKPGRAFMLLLFSAVAVAIMVNAMLFQKARHPAPIISSPATATPASRQAERRPEPAATPPAAPTAAASASPTTAPLPPARPSALASTSKETAAPRPPAAVTSIPRTAPAAAAAPAPARTAAARDPIADLINGTDFRPPAEIKGAGPAKAASPRRTVEN